MGESERILSVKKRPALADVERFKRNVKGENEGEKHPANCTDSAHGMKWFTILWQELLLWAVEFLRKNALSWANAQVGEDLTLQIDPEFRPQEYQAQLLTPVL